MKKVLCSWESPLANGLAGAPGGDYLSRAIVDCSGAPTTDTAFMGLTSCRWITIAKMLAHRRRECAFGIMPTAVSLSNAPPTATPSSVMGRQSRRSPLPRTIHDPREVPIPRSELRVVLTVAVAEEPARWARVGVLCGCLIRLPLLRPLGLRRAA